MKGILLFLAVVFVFSCQSPEPVYIDLSGIKDEIKICNNPHKGWYLHYFDNGLKKYGNRLASDDFLEDFPGMNHLYLRLAWSYLEPREGRFNWTVIDTVIDKWTNKGYDVAFRITCKETTADQPYATPLWVKQAGARGTMIANKNGIGNWEPDYGDPVFLEKLENFHKAFAERYDGKPWLAYVDIGSYGDWGEGHTVFGSKKDWPFEVLKKHIDIYCTYYTKTQLVISDDIVGSRVAEDGSKQKLLQYIWDKGLTLRDDSICVKWFADHYGLSTVRNPDFFQYFWPERPVVLELEHYHTTRENDTWKGGSPLIAAVEETHATYVGFHGYPREWLSENPGIAEFLANRSGYWYFLEGMDINEEMDTGKIHAISMHWYNQGVAPAYHSYRLRMALAAEGELTPVFETSIPSQNKQWLPGKVFKADYQLTVPDSLTPGRYDLLIALVDDESDPKRFIELGIKNRQKVNGQYYKIYTVRVEK